MEVESSPGERLQYDRAVLAGRDISAPVEVTHFFSLGSPGSRPDAIEEALSAMGSRRLSWTVDVHFLDPRRRDGRDVANHFKYLAFPVSFIYVGPNALRPRPYAGGAAVHCWAAQVAVGRHAPRGRRSWAACAALPGTAGLAQG